MMNIVYFCVNFLRVTPKDLQSFLFFFFLFFLQVIVFGRICKSFFVYILSFFTKNRVTSIRLLSLSSLGNVLVNAIVIVKFRMCEYDIPCALEEIIMANLREFKLPRWHGKSKPFYVCFHSAYGHQDWYDGELLWGAPTHKVIWPFDHVVLQDHVTTLNQ